MFGYLDNTLATNSQATVTNLPPSIAGTGTTPYSVIVDMAGDTAGRGGSWVINDTSFGSFVSKGPSNDGVFVQALPGVPGTGVGATQGNYAVFTGIVGTTLNIQADAEMIGSNQRLPFDGFQVVSGIVPEPASAGLFGLAGIGLLARRRRDDSGDHRVVGRDAVITACRAGHAGDQSSDSRLRERGGCSV